VSVLQACTALARRLRGRAKNTSGRHGTTIYIIWQDYLSVAALWNTRPLFVENSTQKPELAYRGTLKRSGQSGGLWELGNYS
jgi:hypothetical protein